MIVKYIYTSKMFNDKIMLNATQHDFLSDFKYGHVCINYLIYIANDFLDRLS